MSNNDTNVEMSEDVGTREDDHVALASESESDEASSSSGGDAFTSDGDDEVC